MGNIILFMSPRIDTASRVKDPGSRGGHIIGHTRTGNPIYGKASHGKVHNPHQIKSEITNRSIVHKQEQDHIYVVQNPTRKGWIQLVATSHKMANDFGDPKPEALRWLRHNNQLIVWSGPVLHETIAEHVGSKKGGAKEGGTVGSLEIAEGGLSKAEIFGFGQTKQEDLDFVKSKLKKIVHVI